MTLSSSSENFCDLSAGGSHSALITRDGVLWVCGEGTKGQLGIGDCEQVFSLVPVRDQKVKKVACGESHTLILSMRTSSSGSQEHGFSVKSTGSNDKY
jgi:alpha-tubulin suppressor-like RCC1 family protein